MDILVSLTARLFVAALPSIFTIPTRLVTQNRDSDALEVLAVIRPEGCDILGEVKEMRDAMAQQRTSQPFLALVRLAYRRLWKMNCLVRFQTKSRQTSQQ